ncbi:MAG: metal ABC transporter permease [Alphaproteobacteria bacterium]
MILASIFTDYAFMRRALAGCLALSLGAVPLGVLLQLRRMSLLGEAMAHGILPGAAIGYLLFGLSITAMSIGGLVAGLLVALGAGVVNRYTDLAEDASLSGFYLISLASGMMLLSPAINQHSGNIDIMHLLFGSLLSLDNISLYIIMAVTAFTLILLAILARPLIAECVDPSFLRQVSPMGLWSHLLFLGLVALNLVAGFQALGTLMVVGLMMLPAITAKFWAQTLWGMILVGWLVASSASILGLVFSFYMNWPSAPSIILFCGAAYLFSVFFGKEQGILRQIIRPKSHFSG